MSKPIPDGKTRNVPTPEGRELGRHLARFCDQEEPRIRAKFPDHAERCASCAFTAGTFPNGCSTTVLDALQCVVTSEPFYCHHDMVGDKPTKLCAGWAILAGVDVPPGVAKILEGRVIDRD